MGIVAPHHSLWSIFTTRGLFKCMYNAVIFRPFSFVYVVQWLRTSAITYCRWLIFAPSGGTHSPATHPLIRLMGMFQVGTRQIIRARCLSWLKTTHYCPVRWQIRGAVSPVKHLFFLSTVKWCDGSCNCCTFSLFSVAGKIDLRDWRTIKLGNVQQIVDGIKNITGIMLVILNLSLLW